MLIQARSSLAIHRSASRWLAALPSTSLSILFFEDPS